MVVVGVVAVVTEIGPPAPTVAPPPAGAGAHAGKPLTTVRTCPLAPIGRLVNRPLLEA